MSTPTIVPVEEYLRMTEKPNREYRDGVVSVKAMPTKLHSLIQKALIVLLERNGVQAFPELTVRISATTYLVPDISVAGDFPGPYPTDPVTLCCEIRSPCDSLGGTLAKCEEYHDWGVPYCWVVDPEKRTAWEYHSRGDPRPLTEALQAGHIRVRIARNYLPR